MQMNYTQETEELKHDHVSRNFALALQKARNDKGLNQKDFATRVSTEKIFQAIDLKY